jgi:membrane fusion protein (multidrug efflux system)
MNSLLSLTTRTERRNRRSFLPEMIRMVLAISAGGCLLVGCGRKTAGGPPGGGPGGPGRPVEVGVMTIATTPVTLTQELPGRVSALRVAEVRARVSGIVQKRFFTEGSDVREGEVLYQIDPAPYEAALKNSQGTLARAQANAASTKAQEERSRKLLDAHAISQQEYDNSLASFQAYQADVLSGQAAVETATINLGYTRVTSPISGRIGISQVTEGGYVQDTAATLLVTVQQIDRVYVDVVQASSHLLRLRRDFTSGRLKTDESGQARARLILEDGSQYPQEGSLQLSDVTVSTTTSSFNVRAIFPNPAGDLLPGMFVRARIEEGNTPDAILVPQLAVTRNTKGDPTALVAGADGKAELRILQTARAVGNQWLVTDGLKPGDALIVDNLQSVRPGTAVKAVPAKLAPAFVAVTTTGK